MVTLITDYYTWTWRGLKLQKLTRMTTFVQKLPNILVITLNDQSKLARVHWYWMCNINKKEEHIYGSSFLDLVSSLSLYQFINPNPGG